MVGKVLRMHMPVPSGVAGYIALEDMRIRGWRTNEMDDGYLATRGDDTVVLLLSDADTEGTSYLKIILID
jgi:hypothetical protein